MMFWTSLAPFGFHNAGSISASAVQASFAVVIGSAAIIDDLRRRRISNWITALALAGGLVLRTFESGWRGMGSALAGCCTGGVAFLVFYLLGGMGGGDVKLMAGFGALLGPLRILEASLWTAACGGLIAAIVIVACRLSRRRKEIESVPYAPAIALGVWLSMVPRS